VVLVLLVHKVYKCCWIKRSKGIQGVAGLSNFLLGAKVYWKVLLEQKVLLEHKEHKVYKDYLVQLVLVVVVYQVG
jgi:hypothetical protein